MGLLASVCLVCVYVCVVGRGGELFWILSCIIHVTNLSTVVLAYDEYEVSPYEELQVNLVRNIEMSRMASIMAGTAPIHS